MKKNIKFLSIIIFVFSVTFFKEKVYAACSYETRLQQYGKYAEESMKETGIYASLTLSQLMRESSFGENGTSNFGHTINETTKADCEKRNGNWDVASEGGYACFTKSNTLEYDIKNHAEWLLTKYLYRNELSKQTTLLGQLEAIKGYNYPNPNYVCELIDQINSCDLTRFDVSNGGTHIENLSNENCKSSYDSSKYQSDLNNFYETSYDGKPINGWIYDRFNYKEILDKNVPNYKIEQNIGEVIDEIFRRAKTSYLGTYGSTESEIGNGPGLSEASACGYKKRISQATQSGEGNKFYFSNKNLSYAGGYTGQCTWYAFGRANEILENSGSNLKWQFAPHAKYWYNDNLKLGLAGFKSSTDYTKPKAGSILVWGSTTYGHVAIVEEVNGNSVTISEANISSAKSSANPYGWQIKTLSLEQIKNRWNGYYFIGYIYLLDDEQNC